MKKNLTACFTLCLLALGCSKGSVSAISTLHETDVVSNQFKQIYFRLRVDMGDRDHFARNLSDVRWQGSDSNLFICPTTRSQPGSFKTIDQWSDYIYIGNNTEQVPYIPLLISPPENHRGEFGCILTVDGVFEKLPPDEVQKIINEPWILATNTSPEVIKQIKQEIIVHVPRKLD